MLRFLILLMGLFLVGCASPAPYRYQYVPGKTAIMSGRYAVAPEQAPEDVRVAIAAANRLVGMPYGYGRGHGPGMDTAYDCSGATSHVLKAIGKLDAPIPSRAFRSYGQSGPGEWISIYARKGHVFLVVAGLRYDTGWGEKAEGPQWSMRGRSTKGCVIRHPSGF